MKELREKSPVVLDKTTDLQLVTRFDGVKNIQTSKNFSSSKPIDLEGSESSIIDPKEYEYFWKTEEFSLLNLEGQLHGDLRNLVAKAFSNRQVQELRPFMENKSSSLLEGLKGEEFDLLKDYAQPYSISVIGRLLGVPEDMYEKFLDWSNKIVKMYDLKVSDKDSADAENAAKEFYEYTLSLIDEKVKSPGDDMITRLANVTENDQKLTKNQIICTVILLLNAGHEATVNTTTASNGQGLGKFYPDQGLVILNPTAIHDLIGTSIDKDNSKGASISTSVATEGKNHFLLHNAIVGGGDFEARRTENVSTSHYFVRATNREFNFSNNPTFVTGSDGSFAESSFETDPRTFISTIGLYNDSNEILAVAKTSQPIPKSFDKEVLIKVKLDF